MNIITYIHRGNLKSLFELYYQDEMNKKQILLCQFKLTLVCYSRPLFSKRPSVLHDIIIDCHKYWIMPFTWSWEEYICQV